MVMGGLILPILEGVQWVMETVTFIEFICEESIQSCGLGVYIAIQQRNYSAAARALNTQKTILVPYLRTIVTTLGPLAPYSMGPFLAFVVASESNISVFEEILIAGKK